MFYVPQTSLLNSLKRSCAIISDPRVKTAMNNMRRQAHNSHAGLSSPASPDAKRDAIFSSVACGRHHSIAMTETVSPKCCIISFFINVLYQISIVSFISLKGDVYVFGCNQQGQLGCEFQIAAHKIPRPLSRATLFDSKRVTKVHIHT